MGEAIRYSLSDYLRQYRKSGTRKIYFVHAKNFFNQLYPELKDNPNRLDEMSLIYVTKQHDYKNDLINYRDSNKNHAPKTVQLKLQAILNFLHYNDITLPYSFRKNLMGDAETISEEHLPTPLELRRICEFLPLGAKALTVFLSSSGCRIGEALQLRLDDIDLESTPIRVNLRYDTTKTNRKRWTYASMEAKVLLVDWLKYRDAYLRQSIERTKGLVKNRVADGDDRIFPFTDDLYYIQWRTALKKAGLLKLDRVTHRATIHFHSLRKYFRTLGNWQNPDIPEALMGHLRGLRGVYARYDQIEKVLVEAYLLAEPKLAVYEDSRTLVELRKQVDEQVTRNQRHIANLSLENGRLETQINEVRDESKRMWSFETNEWMKTTAELVKQVGELKGQVDELTYRLEQERQTHLSNT